MAATHPKVTNEIREVFLKDGVVKIPGAISAKWLQAIADMADKELSEPGEWVTDTNPGAAENRLFTSRYRWKTDPLVNGYVHDSGVAHMAAALMNSNTARLYFDHLLVKEPHTEAPTPWHQDIPYWPFLGKQICSAWVSVGELTVDESSLEFVRGSHKWDRWFQPEAFGKRPGDDEYAMYARNPNYESMPDIEADRSNYDIIAWDMEPGDVVAFHGMSVHGAGGNQRDDLRRRGYTVRYTGDDAWYDTRSGTSGALLSEELNDGDPIGGASYPLIWSR